MSVLTTSSVLHVHLLLRFLPFMHAVLCQLKNIISIQTGRESAGTPPACEFIWFAHRRRSINLLRRETGVLVVHPRADKSIVCLLTRFLTGCLCWHDLARRQARCFTKVKWRPRLKLFLSVISWTPCDPVWMWKYDCWHVWLRLDEIFKRSRKKTRMSLENDGKMSLVYSWEGRWGMESRQGGHIRKVQHRWLEVLYTTC